MQKDILQVEKLSHKKSLTFLLGFVGVTGFEPVTLCL